MNDVIVYKAGVCYASVCVPADMTPQEVEIGANFKHPTGLDHGWSISKEKFKGGESNPCVCNTNKKRKHYLLVC